MIDPVAIGAMVVSGITAIAAAIGAIHIRKMNSGCCSCDCTPGTPLSRTPTKRSAQIVLQPVSLNLAESNGQQKTETGTTNSEV